MVASDKEVLLFPGEQDEPNSLWWFRCWRNCRLPKIEKVKNHHLINM